MEKVNYRKRNKDWEMFTAGVCSKELKLYFLHTKFFRFALGKEKSLIIKKDGTWLIEKNNG